MTTPNRTAETITVQSRSPAEIAHLRALQMRPEIAAEGLWRPILALEAYGTPKPAPRPRAFAVRVCCGRRHPPTATLCHRCRKPLRTVARVHSADTAENWKGCLALAAEPHRPEAPFDRPIRLDVDFYFARPRSGPSSRKKDPDGILYNWKRPDRDNLDKVPLDVLTELGFFSDDGRVVDGRIRKLFVARQGVDPEALAADGLVPGARIIISIPRHSTDLVMEAR